MVQVKQVAQYKGLQQTEKRVEYKEILDRLIAHKNVAEEVAPQVSMWLRFVRSTLGFTFAVNLVEGSNVDAEVKAICDDIEEESVEFTGNIILGLNDGLIELTGVLVGLTSVFARLDIVALSGFITGISAALSMAASAYMQARHEDGKHPKKAAVYTGLAYLIVVLLMIAPFLVLSTTTSAMISMFVIIMLILAAVSFYTAVLFNRSFASAFGEMVFFSMGTALIAFAIGSVFRQITGIEI